MRLSQKDINVDYDAPTRRNSLQRPPDPAFQDRKLPPMSAKNTLAAIMPPPAQPAKSKSLKPSVIPLETRPRTRSQGPVTPAQNLPGPLRKKY